MAFYPITDQTGAIVKVINLDTVKFIYMQKASSNALNSNYEIVIVFSETQKQTFTQVDEKAARIEFDKILAVINVIK